MIQHLIIVTSLIFVDHILQFVISADSYSWWLISLYELCYLKVNSCSIGFYLLRPGFKIHPPKFAYSRCPGK